MTSVAINCLKFTVIQKIASFQVIKTTFAYT